MTGYESCFSQLAKFAAKVAQTKKPEEDLRKLIEDRGKFLITQNSYRKRLASDKTTDQQREHLKSQITTTDSECAGFNRKNVERASYLLFQRYRLLTECEKGLAKDLFRLNQVSQPSGSPTAKQYKELADLVAIPHA